MDESEPYQPPNEVVVEAQDEPASASAPTKPRVWTVFLAFVLALGAAVFFQALLGVVLALIEVSRGTEPEKLGQILIERMASPYMFLVVAGLGQLAFALAAFIPPKLSSEPYAERIGWRKARPSWRVYPIAMLSSIVPLAVGLFAAQMIAKVIAPDGSVETMFSKMTPTSFAIFVVFIGVVPGLVEEVLFRGYMQQRLVKRWGAAKGIIVTSIIFGLAHITPHAIAAAGVLGFWFGYIAWRSNSILPTILCHFFVNSGLNAWRMIIKFGEPSEGVQIAVQVVAVAIGAVCFLICLSPKFWWAGDESS